MAQKASKKAVEIEAPERLWVQLYGDTPMSTVQVNAYRSDPREVHDNGKPVYQYVLVDAPNARQRAERAVAKIVNSLNRESNFYVSDLGCKEFTDIIAAEFEK